MNIQFGTILNRSYPKTEQYRLADQILEDPALQEAARTTSNQLELQVERRSDEDFEYRIVYRPVAFPAPKAQICREFGADEDPTQVAARLAAHLIRADKQIRGVTD